MWKTIKSMLESKKALTMAVSAAVWIAGKAGWHLDNTELLGAVVPMWMYILAQAHVDHAKEKAKGAPVLGQSLSTTDEAPKA